jgi:hypothetical protein
MGNRYEVSGSSGVAKHTDLTDKEVNGVIDHADRSVTDAKLLSGVGLNDGQIAKLPVASQGQVLTRGASAWQAQTPSSGGFNSRVSAYLSANQTIPNGTITIVQFNTTIFDGNSEFSTTNYRFTAANAGYYLVLANVLYYTFTSDAAALGYIYKNGSSIFQNTSHTGAALSYDLGISLSAVVYLVASDYIDIRTYTDYATHLYGGAGKTSLFIHRLS